MRDEDVEARIKALEEEEHEVSALRAKIHERLASFPNPVVEQQERELSARRRELHAEIDRLRASQHDGEE